MEGRVLISQVNYGTDLGQFETNTQGLVSELILVFISVHHEHLVVANLELSVVWEDLCIALHPCKLPVKVCFSNLLLVNRNVDVDVSEGSPE